MAVVQIWEEDLAVGATVMRDSEVRVRVHSHRSMLYISIGLSPETMGPVHT